MNWILAFNLDFIEPKPMSKDEAEKAVQDLSSKVSRQFTKGKTAYKELNDSLSSSYSEAVSALMNPATQSAEAKSIVFAAIADEASVFGSSVPQDQIPNIKKAVINKVKTEYSLPVYKFLDGPDKDATEVRVSEIIRFGIEDAGAHVAGQDEENGYSSTLAKERYGALQSAFSSHDAEYSQINKSLGKLGADNLYILIGDGNEASAKKLPYGTLQARLQGLTGEFESGAEIENLKHLANDVFSSETNRRKYDDYLDLREKEEILKGLEKRATNGVINPKLFMEAATRLNTLYGDTSEALLVLYGFADTKSLDSGTDYGLMESVLVMMNEDSAKDREQHSYNSQQKSSPGVYDQKMPNDTRKEEFTGSNTSASAPPSPQDRFNPQEQYAGENAAYDAYNSPQTSDAWRHKRPQDYSPEDIFNAYQAAKEWRDRRQNAKGKKKASSGTQLVETKSKSKWVAAILAIFLGLFGAQKFYLGHPKQGVITILITFLGAFVGVGPLITGVIGLVEGVKYLIDKPEKFKQTYLLDGKVWF